MDYGREGGGKVNDISLTDVLIAIVSIIGGASIIIAFLQPLANKTKTDIDNKILDGLSKILGLLTKLLDGISLNFVGRKKK